MMQGREVLIKKEPCAFAPFTPHPLGPALRVSTTRAVVCGAMVSIRGVCIGSHRFVPDRGCGFKLSARKVPFYTEECVDWKNSLELAL